MIEIADKIETVSGSRSADFTNVLITQVMQTVWVINSSEPDSTNKHINAVLTSMIGIKPQDEIEGMMAAQMVATHSAAMECYRRAMLKEQSFEARKENLSQANKLTRSYATLVESLNRHRGKGVSEQKVTVQHVHVSDGGQAIVGNVERGEG